MSTSTTTPGHTANPANLDGCLYCGHKITGRDIRITQLGDALVDVCRNRVMCDDRAYLTPMTKAAKTVRVLLTVAKGDADEVHTILRGAYPKSYQRASDLATQKGLDPNEATHKVFDEYQRMHLALALLSGDNAHRTM